MAEVREATTVRFSEAEYDEVHARAKQHYIDMAIEVLKEKGYDVSMEEGVAPDAVQVLPVIDPETGKPLPRQVLVTFLGEFSEAMFVPPPQSPNQ